MDELLYPGWTPAASAVCLLPVWPTADWWALLERLAADRLPLELPDSAFLPGELMLLHDLKVIYVQLDDQLSVGAKRNLAVERCTGEAIVQ